MTWQLVSSCHKDDRSKQPSKCRVGPNIFIFFTWFNVQNAPSQTVRVSDEMNVNNTGWLTARSDQPCRRDPGRLVSLFVLLDLCTSWLAVCICQGCLFLPWLITGCLGLFTLHHYHYHYHHRPHQDCHPLIVSCHNVPRAAWETPWENWQQPSQIPSGVRCEASWGANSCETLTTWLLLSNWDWPVKLRFLIATNWELLCFMIHFTDWRIALDGDTFYPCMSRPFTRYRFMFMRSWHSSSSLCWV